MSSDDPALERFHWRPRNDAPETPAEALLRDACLVYGSWSPDGVERAGRALVALPELARSSVYAAAATGDVAGLRAWLDRDPSLVAARGGPLDWEPLLYCAYSRLDRPLGFSTLATARLLLERGADPDAGFLWHGHAPPFTALTGAFGEGEDGNNQPPHPERDALARLLLEAGADPNDGQTLYNRHFRADDGHLRLLLEFGLGTDKGGTWYRRLGARLHPPRQLLVEELWCAAQKGFEARVALLLAHGADPNGRGVRDGRTACEAASLSGNRAIVETLVRHGARPGELGALEELSGALVAGERERVEALLAREPALLARLDGLQRARLLHRAVEARKPAGLRLMATLGFAMSPLTRNTPLHDAAWAGDLELVRLLVELGADPTVRDPSYHSTPLGWAAHNRQSAVLAFLLPHADVFDTLAHDGVERLVELLRAEPGRARALDARGRAPVFHLHAHLRRTDELLTLLVAHGADLEARDPEGRTALELARAAGHTELASALERHGARPAP